MNHYPSWIQRIPEMIEALELHAADRIDRQTVGELFDLRKTAAFHLLRRFGAERCGNSLAIGRARLMARLREMQEHPDWRWERERREQIRVRIDTLRPNQRRSLVPVGEALQQRIDLISIAGLPDTVRFAGRQTHHPLPRHGTIGFGGEGTRHRLRSHASAGREHTPASPLTASARPLQHTRG